MANSSNTSSSEAPEPENITFIDSKLYWDATKGKIDTFKEDREVQLKQILTPSKNSVLHVYITSSVTGKTNFVEEILRICPELLMQPNANDDIPLHVAARYGHELIVKVLIEHAKAIDQGHDVHDHDDLESGGDSTIYVGVAKEMLRRTNKENNTSLHEAVRFGHLGVVRILTQEDPDYLYATNGADESPLYMAAERGYSNLVRKILANCSLVAAGGPNNRTALHAATIAKDKGMTRTILRNMDHLTKHADDKGWVPLHYAADLNYLWIVKMLLRKDKYAVYIRDKDGRTPLHIAASHGYFKIMREIIQLCPDCCELVDNRGWNVLRFAVESERGLAVKEILNSSPLSYLSNGKDNEGNTPFHFIATRMISKMFLACPRIDKMAFNKQNQNALDMAKIRMKQQRRFIRRLRKAGLKSHCRIVSRPSEDREELDQENKKNYYSGTARKEQAREASLIVAALIATVTFTACFALPGGFVSDKGPLQGTAVLRKNRAFQAFLVTNITSFVFSSIAVLQLLAMSLTRKDHKYMQAIYFKTALRLIFYAMGAMVLALVMAMFAVLEPSLGLAIVVCLVGVVFFNTFTASISKFNAFGYLKFE